MSFRHVLVTAAAVVALTPAAAFAQGAGDDQYSDPFGDEQEQATPAPTPNRPSAPAQSATPARPATPAQPAATAPPVAAQPQGTSAPRPTLPYTGIDAWPLALGGALLLGTGLALRARLERTD